MIFVYYDYELIIYKMDSPYWTIDSAIIFKPEFNESLDNYFDLISNL